MKISYTWLKEYLPLELDTDQLSEILTGIGLEVGAVETVESIRGGLVGVVAGQVMTCEKHPNADRLSLCTVDIGTAETLQIVCGAPNVAAGQKVWVAQVGTTLYPYGKEESFTINKAKVRGTYSEGMICAEDELGLGEDHSGILVLPDNVNVGTAASEYYHVHQDVVFDIDLTPNRSDATSHLGVAADVAAYLRINHGSEAEVRWPDTGDLQATGPSAVNVVVENAEACPRYAGLLLDGISIVESPDWLKQRLTAVGVRPINHVVDVTNFVLHEMGQPLHAFDAERIQKRTVLVKTLAEGTKFVTLDEVERTLLDTDLMICDGQSKGMCIAGVFGGVGTGVTETTTSVFLESAHFDPEWVRRSSMVHQLRTDAARTFEKGTDPNVCVTALRRAASLILEIAGKGSASEVVDVYPEPITPARVRVRWAHLRKLIGVDIPRDEVLAILEALRMEVVAKDDEGFEVAVPTNKADVTRESDVIEEILRIYGFNHVPLLPQMEVALVSVEQPTLYKMRYTLGAMLSSLGFCEMMGLSMTESRHYDEGPMRLSDDQRILIENTSNISLSLMRPDLLVTALETAQYNQYRQQDSFMFYEFGNSYRRRGEEITEQELLSLTLSGAEHPQNWRSTDGDASDFFTMKKYVQAVLDRVGLRRFQIAEFSDDRFRFGLRYTLGKSVIAEFGSLSQPLLEAFDLRGALWYAQLSVDALFQAFSSQSIQVSEISRFPGMRRDLAFDLPVAVRYADLERTIRKCDQQWLRSIALFDVYENAEQLGKGRKSYAVQLEFEDLERTLTDEEVDATVRAIVKQVEETFDARQR